MEYIQPRGSWREGECVHVVDQLYRWWDSEIKERIALRRQLYKVTSGRDDL